MKLSARGPHAPAACSQAGDDMLIVAGNRIQAPLYLVMFEYSPELMLAGGEAWGSGKSGIPCCRMHRATPRSCASACVLLCTAELPTAGPLGGWIMNR